MSRVPTDATSLFVSVGGNDALQHMGLLSDLWRPGPNLLAELAEVVDAFAANYRRAMRSLLSLRKPAAVCTIYNGNLPHRLAAAARAAVALFDDRIYQIANELRLPVLALRSVCTDPLDYANAIEPSDRGGAKIARAVLDSATRRAGSGRCR